MRRPRQRPQEITDRLARDVRGRMPPLDGWRGLAILLVVLHNASYVADRGDWLPSVLYHTAMDAGWIGVSLFFVLSGFLITGILLDTRGRTHWLRSFYLRRTFRIFPLYYGFLALLLVVAPRLPWATPGWTESVGRYQVWYWSYLSNWLLAEDGGIPGLSHFWSLGVEEQFYLLWPFTLLLAGRRFPLVALGIVLLAPPVRIWLLAQGLPWTAPYQFTVARFDGLALGALFAVALRHEVWRPRLHRARGWLLAASTVGLGSIVVAARGLPAEHPTVLAWGQSGVSLLFAVAMLSTLAPDHPLERLASRFSTAAWLRHLGKYSYAMYVGHFPTHLLLARWAGPWLEALPAGLSLLGTILYGVGVLALSYAFARASWYLLEGPALRLKERLAPRPGAALAGETAQ